MDEDDFWKVKAMALLHDPPLKHLIVTGKLPIERETIDKWRKVLENDRVLAHEAFSYELMQIIGITESEIRRWKKTVEEADRWAAGADRPPLKPESEGGFSEACFIHPVSGQKKWLREYIKDVKVVKQAFRSLGDLFHKYSFSWKDRYILLWRLLPEIFKKKFKEASLWPADTRWCDHTLWTHLDMSSAFVGARIKGEKIENSGVLYVKIPGPQRIIRGSKKYRELWGGSHLFSILSLKIVEIIADELGPDSIVYPSLRGNIFVDGLLLYDSLNKFYKIVTSNPEAEMDSIRGVLEDIMRRVEDPNVYRISALPNVIVAIIPEKLCKNIRERIEAELKKLLQSLLERSMEVAREFGLDVINHGENESLEILCSALKPRILFLKFTDVSNYLNKNENDIPYEIKSIVEAIEKYKEAIAKEEVSGYQLRPSIYYGAALTLLKLADKHSLIHEERPAIDPEKIQTTCEICGQAPGVIELKNLSEDSENEILCPICFVRREYRHVIVDVLREHFKKSMFSVNPKKTAAFPFSSHAEISLRATFKLLKRAKINSKELMEKLEEFVRILAKAKQIDFPAGLSECAKNDDTSGFVDRLIEFFKEYGMDIELITKFFSNTLSESGFRKALSEAGISGITDDIIKKLYEKARAICQMFSDASKHDIDLASVARHFVLISFDGDNIGKILSRVKIDDGKPHPLEKFVCGNIRRILGTEVSKKDYGKEFRALPTPSYHAQISAALANFSQRIIEEMSEENVEIIYIGGDDILLITDVLCFSNVLENLVRTISVSFSSDLDNGKDRAVMVMPSCTGSSGVVIAHYACPFYMVLDAAWKQLERAKHEVKGKNATGIKVILRSGPKEEFILRNLISGDRFSLGFSKDLFLWMNIVASTCGGSLKSLIRSIDSIVTSVKSLENEKLDRPLFELSNRTSNARAIFTTLLIRELNRHLIPDIERRKTVETEYTEELEALRKIFKIEQLRSLVNTPPEYINMVAKGYLRTLKEGGVITFKDLNDLFKAGEDISRASYILTALYLLNRLSEAFPNLYNFIMHLRFVLRIVSWGVIGASCNEARA